MIRTELEKVKELLKEEPKVYDLGKNKETQEINLIPILHNENLIILQFLGWSINLDNNGTWYWEDTTGG